MTGTTEQAEQGQYCSEHSSLHRPTHWKSAPQQFAFSEKADSSRDLHHELEALQREMSDPDKADDMDRVLERFGHVQEEYEHLGGYALESQARKVLHGLGFKDDQIDGDVGALSGGWKMRVALARVLLGMPDVLLMDEPTNHLDIESIIWLEQFLKSFPGALLMTSHDREFMNRLVSQIAEIDGGEIITYSGDYDFYERERAVRENNQQAAFARQQSMLAKEQRFIDRFRTHAAKAAQVQRRTLTENHVPLIAAA